MPTLGEAQRIDDRRNAFGFLRLLMASLVVVAHTPELIDGNRSREPLSYVFGSISFGDFAVNVFFIISGYLITSSRLKSASTLEYLNKRIARIYPGFLVAYLVSAFLIPVIASSRWEIHPGLTAWKTPVDILFLQAPQVEGVFPGTHYDVVNAPMWTIPLEFGCYLLTIVLAWTRLLRRPILIVAGMMFCLSIHYVIPKAEFYLSTLLPGINQAWLFNGSRLAGMFLAGSAFYLYRDRIPLNGKISMFAAVCLFFSMFFYTTAIFGVAIFGSYLVFSSASAGGNTVLRRINSKSDISYGLYLYAWPIEKLLIQYQITSSLVLLGIATLSIAGIAGWLSWHLVEKPGLALAHRRTG